MGSGIGERAEELGSPISVADGLLGAILGLTAFSLLDSAVPFVGDNDAALFSAYTRRALDGHVPFADFETYFSPGALALLGFNYAQLGFSASSAVSFQAVVQATLATLVFFVTRGLAARRGIALAAASAQLGVGLAIWPQMSPHSLGSVGFVLVVFGLMLDRRATTRSSNFIAGCFLGFYTWLQHHKGLLALPVVAAYLLADWQLFWAPAGDGESFGRRAGWMATGFVTSVAAFFGPVVWRAGLAASWDGLFVGPLIRYPRFALAQIDLGRWRIEATGVLAGLPGSLTHPEGMGLVAVAAWFVTLGFTVWAALRPAGSRVFRRRALLVATALLAAAAGNAYRSSFVLQAFGLPAVAVGGAFLGEFAA